MKINLGSIQMPIAAATKTFALLAKRGAGKSYTGAVMAEEFYKVNVPFVAFDPIDVWWGLRLAANGKDKGLPVVVFGIEHADIKIDRDMGRKIAQYIVKYNISCVISTFGMPKVAQRHLIAEFSDEILNINNTPRHIFIEEAHEFVPQRVTGAMGKTFAAVEALVVMGRNRGLGVTLINQRAATVNKDVLTQLDTLLAFRNVSPQDRKALKDWVEYHSAEGDFNAFMQSLPSLPVGEGWIWSPEFMGIFEKIKVRKRETFHPDREKLGSKFATIKLDKVDVQSFIAEFNSEVANALTVDKSVQAIKSEPLLEKVSENMSQQIAEVRNEYESKLVQKDIEIAGLKRTIDTQNGILADIARMTGRVRAEDSAELTARIGAPEIGTVNFWVEKLGRSTAAGKILALLSSKGLRMSRTQVRTAVGISAKSSGFSTALVLLKKNSLIVEDGSDIMINPQL